MRFHPRFLAFAKAYQFSTDGTVTTQPAVAQNSSEEDDTIGLYTQTQVNQGNAATTEATYYQANIGNITSVDQLLANPRLYDVAVRSYGLNPDLISKSTIRAVLTSDLSDPNSVASKMGTSYVTFAKAFNFNADGSVDTTFGKGGQTPLVELPGQRNAFTLDTPLAVAVVQPDGEIVVGAGAGTLDLLRFNKNGSIDTSFGSNHTGSVVTGLSDFAGAAVVR